MFIPIDSAQSRTLRPRSSQISPSDWAVLADFWYPLAISAELGDAPVKAKLLDVELVIYRGKDSDISVAQDLCPHRHVRLSAGRIVEGEIECAFHGLRFDTHGKCQLIPALGRKTTLPDSYRLRSFPTKERYGLLWTCLGDPDMHCVPDIPTFADVDPADVTHGPALIWPISAPRQIENFIDLAHLPFVHAKTLGGDPTAALTPGRVEHTDDAVILHANYAETDPDGSVHPSLYRYRVILPFTVEFTATRETDTDHPLRSSDLAVPISAHESLVFQVHRINGSQTARRALVDKLSGPNKEDIAMLRELVRPDLPLDQRHEIHLPVDNISGEYRARLRKLGLGQPWKEELST